MAALIGCVFVPALHADEPLSTKSQQPHIVMAFADDWGCYASAYAKRFPNSPSEVIHTPNFDKIAGDGVLFANAFVSAPSCTPCRSSLLSGQPFWRCEKSSILQGAIWDFSLPAYPLLLEESGYRIGQTYKVWSPGQPVDAPHGGKRTEFESAGRRFNAFSQVAMKAKNHKVGKQQLLDEVRRNIRSFLDADDDRKLDSKQPICYWFGPTNTHRKWVAGSGKALWGIDPDDLKGKLPSYLPDVPVVREDFADYLGEAMAFDAALGVLDEELRRVGIADETLLVVSGDHGVPGVSRGKCNLYDFGTHVPLAIRWPDGIPHPGRLVEDFVSLPSLATTFLSVADVEIPESMIAKPIVDILVDSRSGQIDPERDAAITGRERHVAKARGGYLPYPQRAIQTKDWLYIINFEPERTPMGDGPILQSDWEVPNKDALTNNTFAAYGDLDASPTKAFIVLNRDQYPDAFDAAVGRRPKFEMYYLANDPDCTTNLAENPDWETERQRLHRRLMTHLETTGDPRVSDDVIFESGDYVKPTR
ncbi:sulfatase family protein [Rhodopirellula sallentina]|uniref:Sulfatase atsG n=1 Tax=Rhodopirellula sallentina SM41 TaxID=1263870 RepID=M5TTN7_9BACT|nr:sulfatase atsG [Rhodopirellula sallentina SM41]